MRVNSYAMLTVIAICQAVAFCSENDITVQYFHRPNTFPFNVQHLLMKDFIELRLCYSAIFPS